MIGFSARCFVAFFVAMLCISPLQASAQQNDPGLERVRTLLSTVDTPPSPTMWRAMGPSTLNHLEALYRDATQPGFVRLRAVATASFYPTEGSRRFLLSVAHDAGQGDLFIRQAVISLERAFGQTVTAEIVPFLQSEHDSVREACAAALGRIGSENALAALRARLPRERNEGVRRTIQNALENR